MMLGFVYMIVSVELCLGCIIMKEGREETIEKAHTGDVALRFDKLVEVWLDKGEPLLDAAFNVTTTFLGVSNESSR
jgi:hypothetical protein